MSATTIANNLCSINSITFIRFFSSSFGFSKRWPTTCTVEFVIRSEQLSITNNAIVLSVFEVFVVQRVKSRKLSYKQSISVAEHRRCQWKKNFDTLKIAKKHLSKYNSPSVFARKRFFCTSLHSHFVLFIAEFRLQLFCLFGVYPGTSFRAGRA